jgi:hypothetical protein
MNEAGIYNAFADDIDPAAHNVCMPHLAETGFQPSKYLPAVRRRHSVC